MSSDFVQRGRQLVEQDQYQEAVKVCRLGLLAHPTQLEGRLVLGAALMALRRYDEVLAEMRVALELDPTHARALALKGEALLRKGDALQAAAILGKAGAAAPNDPVIHHLYEEARRALVVGGAGGAPGIGEATSHYPAHRGRAAGGSGSGQVTRPELSPAPARSRRLSDVPPPEVLAVGDRSQTITLDPDLDPDVIDDEDHPTGPDEPTVISSSSDRSDPSIELDSADLIPAGDTSYAPDDVRGFDSAYAGLKSDPTTAYAGQRAGRGPTGSPDPDAPPRALSPFDEEAAFHPREEEPSLSPLEFTADQPFDHRGRARPQPAPRSSSYEAQLAESAARVSAMFPEEEEGVSSLEVLDPATGEPRALSRGGYGVPPGPGLGPGQGPYGPGPLGGPPMGGMPPRPGAPGHGAPPYGGPAPGHGPGHGAPGHGGPGHGGPVHGGPVRGGVPRSNTDDMRVIRAGLGMPGEESRPGYRVPAQPTPTAAPRPEEPHRPRRPAAPRKRRRRRRGLPLIAYAIIALAVVGGAVFAGFEVRDARLDGQIRATRSEALERERTDTFVGYLQALGDHDRIVRAKDSPDTRAARARIAAALAAEFGHEREEAGRLVAEVEDDDGADAAVARAYLALARQDAASAAKLAAAIVEAHPREELGLYLVGRASLLAGDPESALASLREALAVRARPAIHIAIAEAELAAGRTAEALAAVTRATDPAAGGVKNHPSATIVRGRILAAAGRLDDERDPDARLEALLAEARRPVAEQELGVAREQGARAALILAEVRLARGRPARAREALAAAAELGTREDWRLTDELARGLLRVGDIPAAKEEAQAAAERWPDRDRVQVTLAAVALAEDDPERALGALANVKDVSQSAEALAVRGRAFLMANQDEAAKQDLEEALKRDPELRPAVLAMAELDLRRGDPRSALRRLETMYGDDADPPLAIVYASALGRAGEREKAREVLGRVIAGSATPRAYMELARIERGEGRDRYGEARAAYQKAIELSPGALGARLEAATLTLDAGDTLGARESLELLVKDAPESGPALVEAARVSILTGRLDRAEELLDRASELRAAAGWEVARERGRLLLARGQAGEAAAALGTARELKPDSGETRLLLLEAYARQGDRNKAQATLADITKEFRGHPVLALAQGREALLNERFKEAIDAFQNARSLLQKSKASPREIAAAEVWIGRSNLDRGEIDQALEALRRAIDLDPSSGEAHFQLGNAHFDKRQLREAIASYEKAIELASAAVPKAYFFLGISYLDTKDRKRAREHLERFLELTPRDIDADEARRVLKRL